jgi:RNA polymerase sigma factor (sigma-70 family)
MRAARQCLLERYGGAVHRYLLGALRDADAADELAQEFALRFLRGDFRRANPDRGRFRDFVKTAVFRLVVHHQRRRHKQPLALRSGMPEPAAGPVPDASEEAFVRSWRDELLARAWTALQQVEGQTGQPCYTVLRFRADHPDLSSAQIAQELGRQLGKSLSTVAVRQLLHRAREKFGDLLLDEILQSLAQPTAQQLEQELIDLNLLDYCKPALCRRGLGS